MENRQCKEPYGADLLMRYQKGDVMRLEGSVMLRDLEALVMNGKGLKQTEAKLLWTVGVVEEYS